MIFELAGVSAKPTEMGRLDEDYDDPTKKYLAQQANWAIERTPLLSTGQTGVNAAGGWYVAIDKSIAFTHEVEQVERRQKYQLENLGYNYHTQNTDKQNAITRDLLRIRESEDIETMFEEFYQTLIGFGDEFPFEKARIPTAKDDAETDKATADGLSKVSWFARGGYSGIQKGLNEVYECTGIPDFERRRKKLLSELEAKK